MLTMEDKMINVTMEDKMIILEWMSSRENDMLADTVITCAIRAQMQQNTIPKGVS